MLSMGKFLIAAFITWCAVGFVIDLLLINYQPLGRGFFWPIYLGTLGTALFAARMRRIGLVPVLLLITGAGLLAEKTCDRWKPKSYGLWPRPPVCTRGAP
jgi:hypothetical protein